mmetsp:Transcript_8514/g.13100  ORF Transcript_8514/g.13100 Transcript_8514/m.13100 type:complete len:296 (-) Transcript_8514:2561-3448(-)
MESLLLLEDGSQLSNLILALLALLFLELLNLGEVYVEHLVRVDGLLKVSVLLLLEQSGILSRLGLLGLNVGIIRRVLLELLMQGIDLLRTLLLEVESDLLLLLLLLLQLGLSNVKGVRVVFGEFPLLVVTGGSGLRRLLRCLVYLSLEFFGVVYHPEDILDLVDSQATDIELDRGLALLGLNGAFGIDGEVLAGVHHCSQNVHFLRLKLLNSTDQLDSELLDIFNGSNVLRLLLLLQLVEPSVRGLHGHLGMHSILLELLLLLLLLLHLEVEDPLLILHLLLLLHLLFIHFYLHS